MTHKRNNGNGIGFIGALTILFIGLKLTGHITWSWWWVLSPFWIYAAIVTTIIAIAVCVAQRKEGDDKQ